MEELPDWKHRGHHIETRANRKNPNETNILVDWANEAYTDPMAYDFIPDYASKTGDGMRRIGWSDEAGFLITVRDENGHLWGATAFRSSSYDQSAYTREES